MSRIAVIGIGGVGGYIGAALANAYDDVTFVARGKRRESLEKNGLRLHSDILGELVARPKRVVEHVQEVGTQDYIFICVKNYSLEEVCADIKESVTADTVIVPIMNGVDPGERTRELVGTGTVLDSLIYISAYTSPDFSVTQTSDSMSVHIGALDPTSKEQDALKRTEALMQRAKINCIAEADVQQAIWKKYVLNCAYNVLTAYYEAITEEIRCDAKRLEEYGILLREALAVAAAKGVQMPEDYWEKEMIRFREKHPAGTTSSLCRDVMAKRKCELETFSGYLVREAKRLGVEVPLSVRLYAELKKRVEGYIRDGEECIN